MKLSLPKSLASKLHYKVTSLPQATSLALKANLVSASPRAPSLGASNYINKRTVSTENTTAVKSAHRPAPKVCLDFLIPTLP